MKSPWPADAQTDPDSLPEILSVNREAGDVRLMLDIRADLPWFKGHFPGHPVLPGVVQLNWAVMLARTLFQLDGWPNPVKQLKFQHILVPPAQVELRLTLKNGSTVLFSYQSQDLRFSQGKLSFNGG